MQLARILSTYIARQFFGWFAGVFGTMVAVTFLLDYLELLRRGGGRAHANWGILLEMAALKMPETGAARPIRPIASARYSASSPSTPASPATPQAIRFGPDGGVSRERTASTPAIAARK